MVNLPFLVLFNFFPWIQVCIWYEFTTAWTTYHFFQGISAVTKHLSCHFSENVFMSTSVLKYNSLDIEYWVTFFWWEGCHSQGCFKCVICLYIPSRSFLTLENNLCCNMLYWISLLIPLFAARNAWASTFTVLTQSEPHRHFPPSSLGKMLWLGQSLWFSWLQDAAQQETIREVWRTRFTTHRSLRVHGTHGATQWSCGERGREGESTHVGLSVY